MASASRDGREVEWNDLRAGAAQQIRLRVPMLDFEGAEALKARLRTETAELLEAGHRAFVLDVGSVREADSCGVGVLIAMHHQVAEAGGSLAVVGTSAQVQKVLRLMGLDRYLALFPTCDKALRALLDPV